MGNYKFKFSAMVPNAWFYKLKDMSRASKTQNRSLHSRTSSPSNHNSSQNEAFLPSRASYYFSGRAEPEKYHSSSTLHPKSSDTVFPPEPPRKFKGRRRTKPSCPTANLFSSSLSPACSRRLGAGEAVADDFLCNCKLISSPTDIIIDVCTKSSELDLRPIITKPVKKETEQGMERRSPAGIHRVRMRGSLPRTPVKKVQVGRKSVSKKKGVLESFAVVKSSSDPQKDFRDSMVEMIVENNIRKTKDLEELLACYLSLNSNEYHEVIVKEFEQIWFNLTEIRSYAKSTV